MKIKICAFILWTVLCFSSCKTPTESDCATIDWHHLGEKQALNGKPMNLDSELDSPTAQYCRTFNKVSDDKAFQEGYRSGLKRICTYENGVLMGDKGSEFIQHCPEGTNREYSRGYIEGRDKFMLRQRERELNQVELERQKAYFEGMKGVIHGDKNGDKHKERHPHYSQENIETVQAHPYVVKDDRCVDQNIFGKFEKGGGCNSFGCWPAGGSCNSFGCSETGSCSAMKCLNKVVNYRCREH